MGTVSNLKKDPQINPASLRGAPSKSVFIRALMRFQGQDEAMAITIREISSTGMKASTMSAPFPGGKIEIGLRNLGAVPATVIWAGGGMMEVAFDRIINPDEIKMKITGTYTPAPDNSANLRRI